MRHNMFQHSLSLVWLFVVIAPMAVSGTPPRNSGEPQSQSSVPAESREKIEKLLVVIRDAKLRESDPGRVVEAIEELGHVKAVEAIDDLVKLLTFRRTWPWETPGGPIQEFRIETPGLRYPAVSALIEIGQPSVPAMVKVIEAHESSSLESQNALWVIRSLFQYNGKEGIDYLKEAAKHSSSPRGAQRLTDAADKLPVR
ncbi:MAG: hypothetical protein ABSB82_02965 [Terriglobia bacterium]